MTWTEHNIYNMKRISLWRSDCKVFVEDISAERKTILSANSGDYCRNVNPKAISSFSIQINGGKPCAKMVL